MALPQSESPPIHEKIFAKLKRGINHPEKIPPFLLQKLVPEFADRRGIHPSPVDVRDDYITWRLGGFVQGARSRPEFSARLYYDVTALRQLLKAVTSDTSDRALEIGCGYGRLTPWIADFAMEMHAIDPNETTIQDARDQYPEVHFRTGMGQNLPYPDDSFDLLVTWTVLQSIPPEVIGDVTAEMRRVLAPDGVLLIAEQVAKPDRNITWSRSESEYEQLFAPLELLESRPRPVEPTFDPEYGPGAAYDPDAEGLVHPLERVMAFSRSGDDRGE